MRYIFYIVVLLLPAPLWAQSPVPDDFARGARVALEGQGPVYEVNVTDEVYRTVTRADIGDALFFNGNEERLPHAVYHPRETGARMEQRISLPLFTISSNAASNVSQLFVEVRNATGEARLRLDESAVRNQQENDVRAYILDASATGRQIRRLELSWPDTTADFLAQIVVEESDDLRDWQRWAGPVSIAQLRREGATLRRAHIDVEPASRRYVRLRWTDAMPQLRLDSVYAVVDEGFGASASEWRELRSVAEEGGSYVFDQAGPAPVERLRLLLSEVNSVAQVEVASSASKDGPWRSRFRGLVYRVTAEGHELSTAPVDVQMARDQYWRVEVDASTALAAAPVLELAGTPDRFLFIPRGPEPYTLAFGSADVDAERLDRASMVQTAGDNGAGRAVLGASFELGGNARLVSDEPPAWRRWLLWGILAVGALSLAVMMVQLIRQIDRERPTAAG